MKCPGQNKQFWKPDDVNDLKCPACGAYVEFWKDDIKRKCTGCGEDFKNPDKNLGCALWCKVARECLGFNENIWKEVELLRRDEELKERKAKSMKTKIARKIITIDEDKCTGCGECIISCAEGALKLVNGKARLISDKYCDGLGACLKECPYGALSIEEREADEFDEEAVKEMLKTQKAVEKPAFTGCPGAASMSLLITEKDRDQNEINKRGKPLLGSWPVKLELANPHNEVFRGSNLIIVSDCVPFAYRYFHEDFLKEKIPLCGCPKLNDNESYLKKLSEIIQINNPNSISVARMEVPCCSGMTYIVKEAITKAGTNTPLKEIIVKIDGSVSQNK